MSVIEYLVEKQDVKLTYNGKSDGSTILHLACRYVKFCVDLCTV